MSEEAKKVLVVEDEQEMREMVTMRLESAGYQVMTASNGNEALDVLAKELPDLIVSDVLMPGMDGFALYKELKKNPLTKEIPVLILTARGKMEDSFKVVGVDDFIAKPFESADFLEKAGKLANRPRSVPKAQKGTRVLVAGDATEVLENMVVQLKKVNCVTDLVTTGPQTISKAVLFLPQVLIIEVQMEGLPTEEVIRILRQMPQCEKIPILTFSYYRVNELGSEDIRQRALSVGSSQDNCMEAGATEFIGRFNENTFIKSISKYIE